MTRTGAKLAYAILLGVVGAGIIHIVILFLLPRYTERNAWTRLAAIADPYQTVRLDRISQDSPGVSDPMFEAGACRFDLDDGAVHIHAGGRVPFWSMSVYDRRGLNVYSLNDRTASDGILDFVVVSPAEMLSMRKELPPAFAKSIFVETDLDETIVVVRTFVPDETWRPLVSSYLDRLACDPQ